MKYDSGMTYLHKDILAAVRLMCRNDSKIIEELSPNDGPPAPVTLRDYLKAKYGKTNYSMHSGNVRFICNLNNMKILFNNHILNNLGDTVLTLTWSQVTKFIIDNWDDVFKKSAENQPPPAAENPAETDNPKPTYKDVLLEHYPNFDVSRFEEFASNVCVACFFMDEEIECAFEFGCKKHWESECLFEWREPEKRESRLIEEYLNPTDEKETTDTVPEPPQKMSKRCQELLAANNNTDTKTTDLPNPSVPAKVEETTALFDYSELDGDTARNLRECENVIRQKTAGYFTLLGEKFKEAQSLLADHTGGTFEKWYTALGFKRQTVYNLIQRYDFLSSPTLEGREDTFEALPLTLSYEVSKPDAPKELVEKVIDGDITTNAEYIKLKKELVETLERSKAAQDEYESLHSRHYEDLTKWSAETSELKQRINELENRPLEAEIAKATSQISLLLSTIDEKNGELDGTRAVIETLEKEKETLEKEIDGLQSRPVEVAVLQDESVMEELEQLREENKRLKDKNIKNMLLRITLDDYDLLLKTVKENARLYAAVSRAEIIKL